MICAASAVSQPLPWLTATPTARTAVPVAVTVTVVAGCFWGWMVPRLIGFGDADTCTPFTVRFTVILAVVPVPVIVTVPV